MCAAKEGWERDPGRDPGKKSREGRFAGAPELAFLEQNLFRYGRKKWEGVPEKIHLRAAEHPLAEMREIAGQIRYLVRTKGYRYREIAVVTADPEAYRTWADRAFTEAQIPFFQDEKIRYF